MSDFRNPFLPLSPMEEKILCQMVVMIKRCYGRGWLSGGSGNFSVRIRDRVIWQSPSGICKESLTPEDFIPVDRATGQILWPIPCLKVSEEAPVHRNLYSLRSDIRCVVHAHPPATVALSGKLPQIVFQGEEIQKALGCSDSSDPLCFRVAPNQSVESIADFCEKSLETWFDHKSGLVIFDRHGIYSSGRDPEEALRKIEAVEFLCKNFLIINSLS